MAYTKADLRKFFLAGRRYGLTESSEHTTMSFDKFFEIYSQIQEDIKEEEKGKQKQSLVEIMEADSKNGLYDQPGKIKVTIKKDSEAGKAFESVKAEKEAFRESVESGSLRKDKELCDCGKVATWCYMPGYSSGDNPNSCDDCVPRGCSCNYQPVSEEVYQSPGVLLNSPDGVEGVDWKWIEQDKVWCYIDEKGREYPCCEHMNLPFGWDIEDEEQ